MKTAVVILNWNGAELLRRFLPSVVKHTPTADIVVADNGSSDDSLSVLHDMFPMVKVVELHSNHGFAEGYNLALSQLGGYGCFVLLNSDVEVTEGWLEPLVRVLENDASVAVVAPKILSWTDRGKFEYAGASGGFIDYLGYPFCRGRIVDCIETDSGQYDDRREIFWASGAAMCCRADVYAALGGFCGEFFAHMEEIDFCWRVQISGMKVAVEPESRVYHLGGGSLAAGSPGKIYLNHRNNLAMLVRCASPAQRLTAAVLRPPLDLLAAFSYLFGGSLRGFAAVFRAYADFARWHPRLSRERRAIRASVAPAADRNIYKGTMLLRYAFGRRRFDKMM